MKHFKTKIMLASLALCSFAGSAMAALDVDQQAAVDGISTAITDWTGVAWLLFLASMGGIAGITLGKKFITKAL